MMTDLIDLSLFLLELLPPGFKILRLIKSILSLAPKVIQ